MSNEAYFTTGTDTDVSTDQLGQVGQLTKRIEQLSCMIAQQEDELKQAKQELVRLEEMELPALMDEIGLSEVTTSTGKKVSIKDTLYMSVPKKNKRAVAEWLMTHGHGSLVSEAVVATFAKGEGDKVQEAVKLLADNGVGNLAVEETMNTGQLKALTRELTQQGVDVPLELFGAYWKRAAVIK